MADAQSDEDTAGRQLADMPVRYEPVALLEELVGALGRLADQDEVMELGPVS
nr:hypothetical protein [Jiangella ureilytica]